MSKKFNREQYAGLSIGDLRDYTASLKANEKISKGLKEQKERENRKRIEKKILDMVFNS